MIKKYALYLITDYRDFVPVRTWVDISKYVDQGASIKDTANGSFDSGKLLLTVPEDFILGNLNVNEPIPPRIPLLIGEYNSEEDTTLRVKYIFETSDIAHTPLRTKQKNADGSIKATYFYTHEINFVEYTAELEGKLPPDLSIRQPKSQYDKFYTRSTGWSFKLSNEARPTKKTRVELDSLETVNDKPDINNEGAVISVPDITKSTIRFRTLYDDSGNIVSGIAKEDYSFSIFFKLSSNAPQIISQTLPLLGIQGYSFVYVASAPYSSIDPDPDIGVGPVPPLPSTPRPSTLADHLDLVAIITLKYFDSTDTLYKTEEKLVYLRYFGDNTIRAAKPGNLKTTSTNATDIGSILISRDINAKYVDVSTEVEVFTSYLILDVPFLPGYGNFRNVTVGVKSPEAASLQPGYTREIELPPIFPPSESVVYRLSEFNVSIQSSAITEQYVENTQTLYDLALKALNEINLRQRRKLSFSRRLTLLLQSQKCPEMQFEDYSFHDIMVKLCRVAEVMPILGDGDLLDSDEDLLTTISYVKPGEKVRDYNFETADYSEIEKSNTLSEYYSSISSKLTHLISEEDFHTETSLIQATSLDFAQIREENAGFSFSYPIYYTREVRIKKLSLPFTYKKQGVVTKGVLFGNDPRYGVDDFRNQSWNFTERCLEEDIYNALPDVNYATESGRIAGLLSKGNTISYKSQDRYISNLGHKAPSVPKYEPPFTASTEIIANLAVVEAAVILAYAQYKADPRFPDFNIPQSYGEELTLSNLLNLECELTFTCLNEFVHRIPSLDPRKVGKAYEHRVNSQDKILSLEDTSSYMKAEQNKQGNVVISQTMIEPNILSCLETGTRVNNDYIITTRNLKLFNEYVECTYELTKNYALQSDDIKLDVKYERYSIPYDYVKREVLILSHVLLGYDSDMFTTQYSGERGSISLETSTSDCFITTGLVDSVVGLSKLKNQTFAKVGIKYLIKPDGTAIQSEREAILKLHLIKSDNIQSYIGSFVDNYSAGNQVFYEGDFNFAEPYRYSDALGKTRKLSVELYEDCDFELKNFPNAKGAAFSNLLAKTPFTEEYQVGDYKDTREGYHFNITTSLESADKDILIFSTAKTIGNMGILNNDKNSLNLSTRFEDLSFSSILPLVAATDTISGYNGTLIRKYRLIIPESRIRDIENQAICLFASPDKEKSGLSIILRNFPYKLISTASGPQYEINFYAVASSYGQHENV